MLAGRFSQFLVTVLLLMPKLRYSSVVFTKSDMIKIGELSQMRYFRLLIGLTMLDCQRNSKNLNRLKIDSRVTVKVTRITVWMTCNKRTP